MCIIVAKQKGIDMPSKNILETCFHHNNDGAGFMYVEKGQVIIDKGYMDFKSFYKRLKKIEKRIGNLKERALVMHFRIGTQGANDKQTCHPFPISNKVSDLKSTYFKTNVGMVHNGVISKFNYDKSLSDTQLFIRDFVSVFKSLRKDFYKIDSVMKLFEKEISYSKLCFLDNKENIYYLGDKVVDNGIIYSNTTYKPIVSTNYAYTWDYDWEYEYNYYNSKIKNTKKEPYTIDKFIKDHKEFEILSVGDNFWSKEYVDQVRLNECIVVDKDYNVYEVIDNVVSLICTNAQIYSSTWGIKNLTFKGGDI